MTTEEKIIKKAWITQSSPTGAGKTTIVNLLKHFFGIENGRITLDDQNIRKMRKDDLR